MKTSIRIFLILILLFSFTSPSFAFFPRGTTVLSGGKPVPIEAMSKGQYVRAMHQNTGELGIYPITETFTETVKELVMLTVGKEVIEATPDQLFLTKRNWVEAGKLHVGDRLINDRGEWIPVRKIKLKKEESTVYHFKVDDAHTFFVGKGKILVHNDIVWKLWTIWAVAFSNTVEGRNVWIENTDFAAKQAPYYAEHIRNKLQAEFYDMRLTSNVNITAGGPVDNLYLSAHGSRLADPLNPGADIHVITLETRQGRLFKNVSGTYEYYREKVGINFEKVKNCFAVMCGGGNDPGGFSRALKKKYPGMEVWGSYAKNGQGGRASLTKYGAGVSLGLNGENTYVEAGYDLGGLSKCGSVTP